MSQKIKTSVEIDGSLTANSIVKSGGTASQILAADGSVVTAGSGVTISGGTISASGSAGVLSFNTRTGAVTLTSGDVTAALGYTPYNASNPAGYISSYTETDTLASVTARGATTGTSITVGGVFTTKGTNPYIQWQNSAGTRLGYIQHATNLVMSSDTGNIEFTPSSGLVKTIGYIRYGGASAYSNTGLDSNGFYQDVNGTNIYESTMRLQSNILSGVSSYNGLKFGAAAIGNASEGFTIFTGGYDNNRLTINASGNATFGVDARAPIFYDSNNTGYYVDPSSQSNLNSVYATSYNLYNGNTIWNSGNDGSGSGLDADLLDGQHAYSFAKQAYVNVGYDFNTLAAENSDSAIVYRLESSVANPPNGSIYNWSLWQQGNSTRGSQIAVGAYGGNEIYFRGANNDSGSYRGWQRVLHDGNYSSYAVPTSRTITINGTSYDLSANRSWTVSSTVTSGVSIISAGSASNTPSTPSVNIGMYVDTYAFIDLSTSHPDGGWIDFSKANGTDYGGRIRYNNTSDYLSIAAGSNEQVRIFNSNAEALGSFRAPIFYDSNNTAYYLDPSSTAYSSYNAGGARFRNIEISNSTYTDTIQNVTAGGNIWLNYGHNGAVGLGFGGGLTTAYSRLAVNGTGSGTSATLKVNTATNATFVHSQENMAANITAGQHNIMVVGKETNTKNSGYIGYYWAGAASNANFVTIGHWGNDDLFRIYGSGEAVSSVNIQAPIFYDSNDTTYYGDFASTSYLRHLSVGDVNATNDGGWNARLNLTGSSHARLDVKSNSDGIITTMYSHTGQGVGRVGTYSNHPLAFMVNAGIAGYAYANYIQGVDSVRAPIFYDSDNTGYYLNPASISYLSTLRISDASSGASLIVGTNDTSRVYSDDPRKQLAVNADYYPCVYVNALSNNGNTTHGAVISMSGNLNSGGYRRWGMGIANTDPGVFSIGYADNNSNPHYGVGGSGWSQFWIDTSGNTFSTGSTRSPIFYDNNNTAYYVDPASTSNLNALNVGGSGVLTYGNAPRAANSYVMFYEGFTLNANDMSTNSTGFTYSNNAPWTGPIARFSTGGGYDLWLNASYGGDGTALSYRTRNGDAGTNNSWHRIYSDSYKPNADKVNGYGGYDHVGSGLRPFYNWGGSNGGASAPNGSTYTNGISVGSHPSDPAYGFQIANNMWNTGLWTRSYNSYSFDGWVRLLDSSNYSQYCDFGGNTVYGAAFYDANDTSYYVNPAGASSMSSVYASNWFRTYGNTGLYGQDYGVHFYPQNSQGWSLTGSGGSIELQLRSNHNSTIRGYVHADTSNNIGFLTNAGGWGIRVESNRNVHIHGDTLYISADGQGSSNIIMRDGDNGDRQIHCNSDRIGFLNSSGGWGSWCEDNGSWRNETAMYSPIFYDYNDSAYYVDPASTSNLKFLQVGRPSNGQSGTRLLGGQGTSYGAITLDVDISNYGTGIKINNQSSTYANSAMAFFYNGSQCGGVSIGVNSTAYNTSSDYRLKENVVPIESPIVRLKELNPCRFNFINEPSKTVDGFIAHEVQEIIPEAVTGTKDELDYDGTPKHQGIDQSKIVPLLTAALQEAIAKIEELENRLSILENK